MFLAYTSILWPQNYENFPKQPNISKKKERRKSNKPYVNLLINIYVRVKRGSSTIKIAKSFAFSNINHTFAPSL
jgi:hypothetical protein